MKKMILLFACLTCLQGCATFQVAGEPGTDNATMANAVMEDVFDAGGILLDILGTIP